MSLNGKRLLLTGGTGSFARNFIRHLLSTHRPEVIRVYSRDEHKQTLLLGEYGGIKGGHSNFPVRGFIGDVRDISRLRMAMEGVDVVIHAAALKQVQSCEYNPLETIKTNVIGASNVVQAALDCNVEKVIGISTDKAVAPLNLYGATKMCMEKLFQQANAYRGSKRTKFACTRYGNVADSRGTVVHIWRDQVERGIPLSVTNLDATRYWITMKQANQFVLECIDIMNELDGGEVFAPILPSVKVETLLQAMAPNHPYQVIGDRIGDKLHEALILKEELKHTIVYKDKLIVYPEDPSWPYKLPEDSIPYVNPNGDMTSGNNDHFLSVEEIRETLEERPAVDNIRNSDLQQASV